MATASEILAIQKSAQGLSDYFQKNKSTMTPDQLNSLSAGVSGASAALAAKTGVSAPQITSSNSVLSDKNKMDARISAGSALTSEPTNYNNTPPPTTGGTGFTNGQSGYLDLQNQNNQQYLNDQKDVIKAINLKYDTSLANSNQQYASLLNDLHQNYQKDTDIATQQAAALNPYSQAAGAMTARNFNGAIKDKYQEQVLKTEAQARAAENALRAGQTEAYITLTNSMKDSQRTFQSNMMKFMLDSQQQNTQNEQWNKSFGLQQQSFNLESAQAHEGNFMDFVNTFGADPNFKGEINNFFQTGKIGEALMPLVKRGLDAGMSPDEAISIAQYETKDQATLRQNEEQFNAQMSLGWYNANTSRISADTARTKAMQDALAANQGISNVRAEKANTIIDYGMRAFDVLNKAQSNTGGIGATAALWLPGQATQADTLQGYYDTILNNISLTEMQKMKDESKQGSTGFGNQSDKEFNTLRDSMGQLNVQNDPAIQKLNLARIVAAQHNIVMLHAASTGQLNQTPVMMTYQDVLNEYSPSQNSATKWTSPSGKVYNF